MSLATFTTTEEPNSLEPTSLESTLRDYALHYSSAEVPRESNHEAVPVVPSTSSQPADWPTQYRRIPPYRPINRHLDLSERPNGSNRGELLFVTVMMNGVRLQAGLVRLWERTGGHLYPGLTRYKIGGEW